MTDRSDYIEGSTSPAMPTTGTFGKSYELFRLEEAETLLSDALALFTRYASEHASKTPPQFAKANTNLSIGQRIAAFLADKGT